MSATTNPVFADYHSDFEGVISRYSPVLFRVALRRLRNIEDAEDAVQDALLSAHKHIRQFEGRSKLSTWLTTIVTNVSLMKLRRRSQRETLSLDRDHEIDGTVLASEIIKDARPNPETICAQAEMDETLRRALLRLSPTQRSAIQLCELDGLSTREAADALGISKNTLKSRISRARATLRLLLGEVIGTRPADTAAPAVDRNSAVCIRSGPSEHGDASGAAVSVGRRIRLCKPSLVPVCGHNENHNRANLHIESEENCYPPHSLENATHPHPQRYAT